MKQNAIKFPMYVKQEVNQLLFRNVILHQGVVVRIVPKVGIASHVLTNPLILFSTCAYRQLGSSGVHVKQWGCTFYSILHIVCAELE